MAEDLGLERYRWKQRLLLLFAASPDDEGYQAMQQELEGHADELSEREMLVGALFDHAQGFLGEGPATPAATRAARRRWSLAPGTFALLLIGKDGTLKRRDDTPVALDAIFAEVDAMPMRRQEMRGRGD